MEKLTGTVKVKEEVKFQLEEKSDHHTATTGVAGSISPINTLEAKVMGEPSPPLPDKDSPRPGGVVRPWESGHSEQSPPQRSTNGVRSANGPTRSLGVHPVPWPQMMPACGLAPHQATCASDLESDLVLLMQDLSGLVTQPGEHREWAQGLYAWHQFEMQRLHQQFTYLLMLAPRAQHQDMQASHMAVTSQLIRHTRMLIHSHLQATAAAQRSSHATPLHSRPTAPASDSDNSSETSHSSSDDSAYISSSSLSSPQGRGNSSSPPQSPPGDSPPVNKRSLPSNAVRMMEEWYQANFDHPYPNNALVQKFAAAGSITVNQVKKWMANKRVRSLNTLSYNGSIHPKRLQRMLREQEAVASQQHSHRARPYPRMGVTANTNFS